VYADAGSYEARLTVTDDEGCSTTVIYTGQTTSCNGSARAQQTHAVHFDPPPQGVDPPPAVPSDPPPTIAGLRVKPTSFAASGQPTALTKRGARIVLRLSEDAKVRFRIRRAPARTGAGTATEPHVFKRRLATGRNSVPFTGTLGKRTFKPGRYRVIARARDSAKQPSQRKRARFTIKRQPST
jgi:hypothetical protein